MLPLCHESIWEHPDIGSVWREHTMCHRYGTYHSTVIIQKFNPRRIQTRFHWDRVRGSTDKENKPAVAKGKGTAAAAAKSKGAVAAAAKGKGAAAAAEKGQGAVAAAAEGNGPAAAAAKGKGKVAAAVKGAAAAKGKGTAA
ncbi:hypothetical protein JB92DRAFT_3101906 [Gautieria morchelliformis]|nr:hypothetical protein JB92DRAFT_3101906 [Gautieria morchelliformis]